MNCEGFFSSIFFSWGRNALQHGQVKNVFTAFNHSKFMVLHFIAGYLYWRRSVTRKVQLAYLNDEPTE